MECQLKYYAMTQITGILQCQEIIVIETLYTNNVDVSDASCLFNYVFCDTNVNKYPLLRYLNKDK